MDIGGNSQFLTQIRKRKFVKEVIAKTRGRDTGGPSLNQYPSS